MLQVARQQRWLASAAARKPNNTMPGSVPPTTPTSAAPPAAPAAAVKTPLVIQEPSMAVKIGGLLVGMFLGETIVSYWALGRLPQFNDADFRSGLPPKTTQ